MAVTTEPPWIRISSGVAPRNGTTTHTIPFGWTAAVGSLLVVILSGSVTHTVTGWTERLQPVNNSELSVFTKTSTGESSITATHNGSNYPVQWVAYEFPAGTTWTNGIGNNATNDTFPSLTGLGTSAQVIIAARARAASTVDSTAATTWGTGWIEDYDFMVNSGSGTDGVYLTSAHRINSTTTSITASATTAYVGGYFAGDRQQVVFALNAAVKPAAHPVQPWASLHIGAINITSLNLGSTLLWQA